MTNNKQNSNRVIILAIMLATEIVINAINTVIGRIKIIAIIIKVVQHHNNNHHQTNKQNTNKSNSERTPSHNNSYNNSHNNTANNPKENHVKMQHARIIGKLLRVITTKDPLYDIILEALHQE